MNDSELTEITKDLLDKISSKVNFKTPCKIAVSISGDQCTVRAVINFSDAVLTAYNNVFGMNFKDSRQIEHRHRAVFELSDPHLLDKCADFIQGHIDEAHQSIIMLTCVNRDKEQTKRNMEYFLRETIDRACNGVFDV